MERRMMIGLKQLAETGARSRRLNNIHLLLWTVTLAMFLAAGLMVIRSSDWRRPLLSFIAAAAVFQILTLGQPSLIVGVLLVAVTAATFAKPFTRNAGSPSSAGRGASAEHQAASQ
jgi:chromate transport protein ChrA